MDMSDVDAQYDLELESRQLNTQLDQGFSPRIPLEEAAATAVTAATTSPTTELSKTRLPCLTEKELNEFHRMMADPEYPNNKMLLNSAQRIELLLLLENEHFKPAWFEPKNPKSVARLSKLKHNAKTNYCVKDKQLYRIVRSKDRDDEEVLRQAFVYDAGDIIVACHKAIGHAGEDKTAIHINSKYYGISRMQVRQLLKHCVTCIKMAPNKTRALQPIHVEKTLERLQIDLMDMGSIPAGPFKWILHIKDHFSKYSMLYALITKESSKIADCLQEFVRYYGVPEIIQSDNGREFKGAVAMLCKRLKIKVINGRPRHPQTQGLVEQANGVAKKKINAWIHDTGSKYWPDALPVVEAQMNNQGHTSLPRHLTPFKVFNNRQPRMLPDLQATTDAEWIELIETVEEDAISSFCNQIHGLKETSPLQLNLAKDLLDALPEEKDDSSRSIYNELQGNTIISTAEEVEEVETLLQKQDKMTLQHQELVRERMKEKYLKQNDVQQFEVGQIVTLKLPIEDRSAVDDRRLFCKVIEVPVDNKHKLQCQYGIISNLYPTRQLNYVHPILQTRISEASDDWHKLEITLTKAARLNSTSDRVAIKCSCRGKCTGSPRCQCSKNQKKCTQYCHDAERQCDNSSTILEGTEQAIITVAGAMEAPSLPILTRKRSRANTRAEDIRKSRKAT